MRALAWGGPSPDDTLLVLAAPGLLAAWNTRTGSVTWRREFEGGLGLASLAVDGGDARRVALAGPASGHVVLLTLASVTGGGGGGGGGGGDGAAAPDGVTASSFRVGGGGAPAAAAPATAPPAPPCCWAMATMGSMPP